MIVKPASEDTVELKWFKSSHSSGPEGDSCVEIATVLGVVHVRDSKNVRGPILGFAPGAWADFVAYASGV
ncbi:MULTISPECIES: DUF397 domain-containing protein [Streptomyces]|uniref:DUF397 domain-containing protein n=1 Tax=Streptomyces kasugaensis TaxID=1946 RepID=A0A4Q9HYC6_STRKA|nr:DUF397 domain-containing protein [Streptomyces kasugaensis]TBO59579.1 DUF397 domain-containing protein [Streptomyces kasugaensis]